MTHPGTTLGRGVSHQLIGRVLLEGGVKGKGVQPSCSLSHDVVRGIPKYGRDMFVLRKHLRNPLPESGLFRVGRTGWGRKNIGEVMNLASVRVDVERRLSRNYGSHSDGNRVEGGEKTTTRDRVVAAVSPRLGRREHVCSTP